MSGIFDGGLGDVPQEVATLAAQLQVAAYNLTSARTPSAYDSARTALSALLTRARTRLQSGRPAEVPEASWTLLLNAYNGAQRIYQTATRPGAASGVTGSASSATPATVGGSITSPGAGTPAPSTPPSGLSKLVSDVVEAVTGQKTTPSYGTATGSAAGGPAATPPPAEPARGIVPPAAVEQITEAVTETLAPAGTVTGGGLTSLLPASMRGIVEHPAFLPIAAGGAIVGGALLWSALKGKGKGKR